MRKIISTMMALLVAVAVFAQTPKEIKPTNNTGFEKDLDFMNNEEARPMLRKKDEVVVKDWYRFVDDWRALSGGFQTANQFFSIFPDTFVKNLYLDENTNSSITQSQAWCGIGTMFDANDDNWSDLDIAGIRDWYAYEIDSIFFTYGYFRTTGADVVDTLIIQIYNESQVTDGTYNLSGTPSSFGTVAYDQDKGLGANYTQLIKVAITEADSNELTDAGTFYAKTMAVELDNILKVPANGACAVTVIFKPGTAYAPGDTLYFDPDLQDFGVEAPINKFNRFGLLAAVQTPIYTPLQSQNNGLFISRQNRYDDPFTGGSAFMNNKFLPNLFGSTSQFGYYPYIAFKVNAEYNTGLDGIENNGGFGLGNVFPNPATLNSQMTLSFAINNSERVNISVYDLTGKKVQTITNSVYDKGEHTLNFESSNLKPGMYIYSMTAGSFTTSKKFNVVK